MDVYGKSDVGLIRDINQDDIKFEKVSQDILWAVVCDGMGGAKGGDIASKVATSKIADRFKSINANNTNEVIGHLVKSAISEAGAAIYDMSLKDDNLAGMGTTVVAAFINKNIVHVAHAGDSRAYLINSSGINQITVDHSVVQDMILNGDITKEEAAYHPQKNIITRALGIKQNVFPDYNSFNIASEDAILLCTDGLTNELKDEEIFNIFNNNRPKDVPENLIEEVKKHQGADNITAALINLRRTI